MTQTAYEYVTTVLKINPEEGESQRDYLVRVAYEIQGMDETAWDQLPVPCQEWYNSAADMIASASEAGEENPDYNLPELPGTSAPAEKKRATKPKAVKAAPAEAEAEVEGETEGEATGEVAKRGRGRPKGSPSVPKAEKPEKEPRGPIAAASVREVLCKNMDLSLDETMAELEKMGVVMQRSSCQVEYGLAV